MPLVLSELDFYVYLQTPVPTSPLTMVPKFQVLTPTGDFSPYLRFKN